MARKILVQVDRELESLIPIFMSNRKLDVQKLQDALFDEDYASIRLIGHSMKGTGGAYGFDDVTVIGGDLERAALAEDGDKIATLIDKLTLYIDAVDITFV